MRRHLPSATSALVAAIALVCSDCAAPCAHGHTEIRPVLLTAVAGAALDESIAFSASNVGVFKSVTPFDAPEGLTFTLSDLALKIGGSVATPGTYSFKLLVQGEAGEACAPWSRFDVELTVH